MWKSGAFLSGGVDSGYLASALPVQTRHFFTVGFDEGDRYSEVNKAAESGRKSRFETPCENHIQAGILGCPSRCDVPYG
ncbi:MAG: asparagine synthase-related protein [Blautia sp.]